MIIIFLFPLWLKALSFESAPVVNLIETNHVSIEWMSDELASAMLYYGHNVNLLNLKIDSPNAKFHRVKLQNLSPNTQYYFKLTLKNNAGKEINTQIYSFKTKLKLPQLYPLFAKQPQFEAHNGMAKLYWETNVPTVGTIRYGTDTNLQQSQEVLVLGEKHEIDLEDLKPQTKYFFKVEIQNASGAKKMSQLFEGMTPELTKKPLTIELELSPTVSQITSHSALLEIILNQEAPITIYYGKTKNLEKKIDQQKPLKEYKIKFENLESNQTYYYKIISQEKNLSPIYEFRTNFY
ncbi:MAG: hypothetical protein HYW47_05635 [Deltaproteobacteria bacterium]|nr:hypothetical protein [Deltaproteobacteria bacterium]